MESFILTTNANQSLRITQNIDHITSTSDTRTSFPKKLYCILSDPNNEKAITWLPDGYAWKVLNQNELETEILPQYFSHNSFASFMRQVNAYGFQRKSDEKDANIYYHKVRHCDNNKFEQL